MKLPLRRRNEKQPNVSRRKPRLENASKKQGRKVIFYFLLVLTITSADSGKKKKGFLTPERKKKLRKLLMMKAADNLKTQQKQLESERNNVLSKRLPQCPNIDGIEDKGLLPFSCCKKYIIYCI